MTKITNSVIPGGIRGPGNYQTSNISTSGGQPPKQRPTDLPGVTPGGPSGGGAYAGGVAGGGGTGLTKHSIDVIDQGFFIDTDQQGIGLLDGSLGGFISDGQGNYTWAFKTLNVPGGVMQTSGGPATGVTEPQQSQTQAPLSEDQFSFDTTVDFVEDLGADATGAKTSDNALSALNGLQEKVKVNVPPGNYRFTAEEHDLTNPQAIGLVTGVEQSEEAIADGGVSGPTFIVPAGFESSWLRFSGDLLWKGINIDRSKGSGPEFVLDQCGKVLIEAVEFLGPDVADSDGSVFSVAATKTVVFRDIDLQGGNQSSGQRTGITVTEENTSSVWLETCTIEDFSGGGYVGHKSKGSMTALGGTYRNNAGAQIKVPSSGHLIDGSTIKTDSDCQYVGDIDGVQTA